ncbi:unnamed protein product [Ixodes hexagonus]
MGKHASAKRSFRDEWRKDSKINGWVQSALTTERPSSVNSAIARFVRTMGTYSSIQKQKNTATWLSSLLHSRNYSSS